MKDPRVDLEILAKAPVTDPIIAANTSHASVAGNAGNSEHPLKKFTVRLDLVAFSNII